MDRQRPPQISFVVPAFNEETLLPACLQAIQAEISRAGCDAELIVVDNASTDATASIIRATPGAHLVHAPIKGLVQARRAGLEAATGELIANIDADTLVPPGWLTRVLHAFQQNPGLVAISGPYDYYDVPVHIRLMTRIFYAMAYTTYLFNKHVLGIGSMVQGGNFVALREAMQRSGFSDRFQFYGEDTDSARRLMQIGDVRFTWSLMAKSSGRRLRGDGVLLTGLRYGANYLWATFLRRPFTDAWNDYR